MSPRAPSARRGRTAAGRSRAALARAFARRPEAPPLLKTTDHGAAVAIPREVVAPEIQNDGWVDAFLGANDDVLRRLALTPVVTTSRDGARLAIAPSTRIGAAPLRSASARRVVAGLLVAPRFHWDGMGRVLGAVAFRVEPEVGGGSLVPGSAREVPPWVLAGPVLTRLREVLRRASRQFALTTETRQSPRGGIDWRHYAASSLPSGRWAHFRCTFPELRDDEALFAAMRWTTRRVRRELELTADAAIARALLDESSLVLQRLGPGPEARPARRGGNAADPLQGGWLAAAWDAMGWIADERGLGGERSLDGLPWSLRVDQLWEAWVETVLEEVARRTGGRLTTARRGETTRPFHWASPLRTMSHLAPDFVLDLADRAVFVDAKYKPHLMEVRRVGWESVGESTRAAHRADLHQALAYAALAGGPRVETMLAYPAPPSDEGPPLALAEVASGAKQAYVTLAGLPFGFATPPRRERVIAGLERHLRRTG